jgi:hypothetical protein
LASTQINDTYCFALQKNLIINVDGKEINIKITTT